MYTSSTRPEIGQIILADQPATTTAHPAIVLNAERTGELSLCPLTSNPPIGHGGRTRPVLPTWHRIGLRKPTYLYQPWASAFASGLVTVIHTIGWIDLPTLHTLAYWLPADQLAQGYHSLEQAALSHHRQSAA